MHHCFICEEKISGTETKMFFYDKKRYYPGKEGEGYVFIHNDCLELNLPLLTDKSNDKFQKCCLCKQLLKIRQWHKFKTNDSVYAEF